MQHACKLTECSRLVTSEYDDAICIVYIIYTQGIHTTYGHVVSVDEYEVSRARHAAEKQDMVTCQVHTLGVLAK